MTVTSYRHDDHELERTRRWVSSRLLGDAHRNVHGDDPPVPEISRLLEAATTDRLTWEEATITVEGAPTRFALTVLGTDDLWVAIGQYGNVDVSIEAAGVPFDNVRLVPFHREVPPLRLASAASPRRLPGRREEPTAESLGRDDQATRVEVVHRDGRLVGSTSGLPVDLELDVPRHVGQARGIFAGERVEVLWDLGSNYFTHPDVPGSLRGSFAGDAVTLDGTFHLDANYIFQRGAVSGRHGDLTIEVHLAVFGTQQVAATGTYGSTPFAFSSVIAGDRSAGRISGLIGDQKLELDLTADRPGSAVRVTGISPKPAAVLAALVATALYFV